MKDLVERIIAHAMSDEGTALYVSTYKKWDVYDAIYYANLELKSRGPVYLPGRVVAADRGYFVTLKLVPLTERL